MRRAEAESKQICCISVHHKLFIAISNIFVYFIYRHGRKTAVYEGRAKMKTFKILKAMIALVLVLTALASLAACGGKNNNVGAPAANPPETSTSGNAAGGDSAPDSAAPLSGNEDIPVGVLLGGDHSNREPFKIAYLCNMLTWAWNKAISDALGEIGKTLNYEYTAYACNGDFDAFVNQIYTYADQGYDALVLGTDDQLAARALEAAKECEIPVVGESTAFMDQNGICIYPSVQQAQYGNGAVTTKWLLDNYKNYWGDIDLSKESVGLIGLNFSAVSGINERKPGVMDTFAEQCPGGTYFDGDLVALGDIGFSADGANQLSTQIFSQNPGITKWFVVAFVDDWAVGATRAVEQLGMEDKVLVACIQADAFLAEMNSGYSGDVFVASCAVSSTETAIDMANCLVAILEGRVTAETIWPEWYDEGGSYPRVQVSGNMITRDTYQAYLAEQAKLLP